MESREMDMAQHQDLLELLKAVAQEQRLTMIGMMNDGEQTVSELAEQLQLTEPTVSHHISKLHSVGLLHLRMQKNQRFYRLNKQRLAALKKYVGEIEVLPTHLDVDMSAHNQWIEALDWDDESKKVLRDYTFNGKMKQFPAKEKRFIVLLRWIVTHFQPDVRYTEKQVNTILSTIHEDYATLRRSLVDYGFMRRERGGGDYWLTPEDEG